MAKPVFLAGGITAEDWSWLKAMAVGLENHPNRSEIWPEPAPSGMMDRLVNNAYMPAAAERIVAEKQARIEELEGGQGGQGVGVRG